MRNIFQHEKINLVSPRDHVIFFLLYKIFTIQNDVSGDFPKICAHFPKIFENFQNCSEGQRNVSKDLPKISGHFPMIAKDCRRRQKKIRRCFDYTPKKGQNIIFNKNESSQVRISYRFYQFVTTYYTTDFI